MSYTGHWGHSNKQDLVSVLKVLKSLGGWGGRQQQKNMISTHEKNLVTYQSMEEASSQVVQSEQAS